MKVSHRLMAGFGVLFFLGAGLGIVLWASAAWQASRLNDLADAAVDATEHADGMWSSARAAYDAGVELLLLAEQPVVAAGARAAQVAVIDEQLATFEAHLESAMRERGSRERLAQIAEAFALFRGGLKGFTELTGAHDEAGAGGPHHRRYFEAQVHVPYAERLSPHLSAHLAGARSVLGQRIEGARAAATWAGRFAAGGLLLLLLAIAGVGATLTRMVRSGTERTIAAANAIASGQLRTPLRITAEDEFGEITEALNDIVVQLSAARVSKTYVENIVRNMADPLVVVDPDVCIAMVNPALLDLLGYEQDHLLGASVTKIFAHTGRNRGSAIKRDIEQGLSSNVESSFRTSGGAAVPVSLSSAIVRANGQIQGLVLVAKDITAQKKREDDLIQARDEAERMVQLRDAFLANMSHEIRTPLTGILGSAQILTGVVQGEHRNLACIIEDAGNRLLDTINSVLEMARIEAGEVQPEMEVLDFVQEAQAVANVLQPVAERKGLTLAVRAPAEAPIAAQLDRSCLNRILNNLVGNAIKFTNEGAVLIEVGADGGEAYITVRDTGIGISKEFLPHLFDDFKQESTGLKRSHEGTGLGLAITRKLVDMMGGTIHVDSVKGLGSAFTIRFERAPASALAPPPAAAPPAAANPARAPEHPPLRAATAPARPAVGDRPRRDVLLVEDNHQNAYMARFMLEDYTTDVATTPEEALDLVSRFDYRVLLVDINLGTDISGIDLLKTFRTLMGYERTPAIAVTAYALPGDRERFLGAGFSEYVSKPYRREVLQAAIEEAIAREAEQPAPALDEMAASFEKPVDKRAPGTASAPASPESPPAHPLPEPYPTASPDEFLPADFRPQPGAFSEEAAQVVLSAEKAGPRVKNTQQATR